MLRYRVGARLSQRDIAVLLDIGEARVSRIVASAAGKLRDSVRRSLAAADAPSWQVLEAALRHAVDGSAAAMEARGGGAK